jgi:hypothetical protein
MRSKSRKCLVIHTHQVSWILIYFMYMIVHLRTGAGWNLVALGLFPLWRYLVYPTMDLER